MKVSDYVKNKMIDSVCKGTCFDDPTKCKYYGIPPQFLIDELGEDYEPEDNWYKMEDCPNILAYQNTEESDIKFELESAKTFVKPFVDLWYDNEDLDLPCTKEELFDYVLNLYLDDVDISILGFHFILKYSKKCNSIAKRSEYVYLLLSDQGTKIGRSHEPQQRSRTIGTKTPFEIKETKIFKVSDMAKVEIGLHHKYKEFRLNGEWFNLSEDQINKISKYLEFISC